ncbi:hypothetical protein cand_023480 [Cryptosporidium andersoni]|uniref:HIT-type domain-containing protein n=1 Tax=Cryptosporidium andersoni TaxID=117008 RepID=A0A1J4MVU2_9CRYT|nr:hypothetical protein cand_023480 [Cryptosporidium andersoni]
MSGVEKKITNIDIRCNSSGNKEIRENYLQHCNTDEDTMSLNPKICTICRINRGIYKFRCCNKIFCSSKCFSNHNTDECKHNNLKDINSNKKKYVDKVEELDHTSKDDILTEEDKIRIRDNLKIRDILDKNCFLLDILQTINDSGDRISALANILERAKSPSICSDKNNVIFMEFLDILMHSLGDDLIQYKDIYKVLINDCK